MTELLKKEDTPDTVLIVENEVLVRIGLAQYLRHCGYRVIEASSAPEAKTVLMKRDIKVDIVFNAVGISNTADGFLLSVWIKENRPEIHVILAADLTSAAKAAGKLCEEGPHLKKPYEPEQVIDWIKRLKGSTKPPSPHGDKSTPDHGATGWCS